MAAIVMTVFRKGKEPYDEKIEVSVDPEQWTSASQVHEAWEKMAFPLNVAQYEKGIKPFEGEFVILVVRSGDSRAEAMVRMPQIVQREVARWIE